MATKVDRIATFRDRFVPIKSNDTLITWSWRITWQTKTIISPLPYSLWSLNLGGWWLALRGFMMHKVTWCFDHIVLQDRLTNQNHYTSTITVPMSTKLENMLTYLDGLLPIKSHGPFIIWSCEMKWQSKTITSPLQQCLWPPILTGSWLTLSNSYPKVIQTFGHVVL